MSRQEIILKTPRLYLRPFDKSDLVLLHHLDSDPEILQYIGKPKSKIESEQRFHEAIKMNARMPGFGKFMIIEKETDKAIGWALFGPFAEDDKLIELGYRLKKEFWGKGYASEISKALVEYGFMVKKLDKIIGVTLPENIASQKVLENAGLKYIDIRSAYGFQVKFYEISKTEYYE